MAFHRSERRNDAQRSHQPFQPPSPALHDVEQEVLRGASLVIAGCGPVGAQVAIALVETGAEWLILADTGRHATRQSGPLSDQLFDVNPFANVDVAQIDSTAVDDLVSHADLIIDTLDPGSSDTTRARYLLHSTGWSLSR
jgi:threonine dehydrogenase-like Zn-dependent dehydrogenase